MRVIDASIFDCLNDQEVLLYFTSWNAWGIPHNKEWSQHIYQHPTQLSNILSFMEVKNQPVNIWARPPVFLHQIFQQNNYHINVGGIKLCDGSISTKSFLPFLENHITNSNAACGLWVTHTTHLLSSAFVGVILAVMVPAAAKSYLIMFSDGAVSKHLHIYIHAI